MTKIARLVIAWTMLATVFAVAAPTASAANDSARLELRDLGGKRVQTVDVTVPEEDTAGQRLLVLHRAAGTTPLKGVQLVVDVNGVTATLTPVGTTSPLTLPPAPSELTVQLSVTFDAARFGSVDGTLYAITGTTRTRLAALRATRVHEPVLTLPDSSSGSLSVATTSTKLAFDLALEANDAGARDVTVAIGTLRSDSNSLVKTQVGDVEPAIIPADDIGYAHVTATLPEPGGYTGTIVVTHDGLREPAVRLTVTRTRSTPNIDVDGSGNDDLVWWVGRHSTVAFTITENAGGSVALALPSLVGLNRTDSDVDTQPSNTAVTVRARDIGTKKWRTLGADGLAVDADRPQEVQFAVPGVNRPGTYTATVKIREAGGASIDREVKFFVRYPMWMLLIAVAFGIAISYFVRVVLVRARTRALLLRRLNQSVVDLGDALADPALAADDVVNDIVEQILQMEHRLVNDVRGRFSDLEERASEVERFETRAEVVPQWVRLHRLIAGVEPPALLAAERTTLDTKKAALLAPGTSRSDLDTLAKELHDLDGAVITKLADALQKGCDALSSQLDDEEMFLTSTQQARVAEVRVDLDKAQHALQSGRYADASVALSAAQERLVNLLIADLRAYVDALPAWAAGAQDEIKAEVLQKLQQPGPPRRRYESALELLLELLTKHARQRAVVPPLATPELAKQVTDKLDTIPPLLDKGALREARERLAEAVELAGNFAGKPTRSARTAVADRVAPVAANLPSAVHVPGVIELRERRGAARTAVSELTRRTRLLSRVSLVVAAFVALGAAAVALYSRDWGSWSDIFIAVAWGLGVHVGTSFTFSGLDQLASQLEGAPAAAGG